MQIAVFGMFCISQNSIQTIQGLIMSTFGPTITFLRTEQSKLRSRLYEDCVNNSPNETFGLLRVTSFLNMLTAVLDDYFTHKRAASQTTATAEPGNCLTS